MSDFLSRLGARQTSEPAIRPRTVSRFESAGTSPIAPRSENFSPDAGEVHLNTNSLQSVSAKQTENSPTVGARGSERHAGTSPTSSRFRDARATHDVDVQQRLRDLLSGVAYLAAERLRVDGAATENNPPEPLGATLRDETEPVARRDSVNTSATITTNIAPRVEAVPPMRTPRETARMDSGAIPREPHVVHVHIGRVEVRAVHAAPERTRTRNQTSAENSRPLSLEKYLGAKEHK